MTHARVLMIAGLVGGLLMLVAAASAEVPQKKLIKVGWDFPRPSYVAEHIREMEKEPFDGIIMDLRPMSNPFTRMRWDENWDHRWPQALWDGKWNQEQWAAELAALERIEWNKFTDNFIIALLDLATSETEGRGVVMADWFSDDDWDAVLHNVGLLAHAAQVGRCKGIAFDPEVYGAPIWKYSIQEHAAEKSFPEYAAMVRQRGAQFMAKIQEYLPQPVIHCFFLLGWLAHTDQLLDPAVMQRRLPGAKYALYPAFVNGMLDAAGSDTIITAGNEISFYNVHTFDFYREYHYIHQTVPRLGLIAPENLHKYWAQVQSSYAIYPDHIYHDSGQRRVYDLTPEELKLWCEHNTYYALFTADEYAWLYTETMDWWENKDMPEGLHEAVTSARNKIRRRAPLGFDWAEILQQAEARQKPDAE